MIALKTALVGGVIVAGAAVGLAPTASAFNDGSGQQDAQYLKCLAMGWGFSSTNPIGSITWGHYIAGAIKSGQMSPLQERDYVYVNSDIPSLVEANVMVNCSTSVYLGSGPLGVT